jgi:hypothetical protein
MSSALSIYRSLREDLGPADLTTLRADVRAHFDELLAAQRKHELVAIDLAEALATRLDTLLSMAHLLDSETRAHVVGAARYFVSSTDAQPDAESCTGLDDDVEVFNHVVGLLGRDDLTITD